jgi:hypothetical protein
MMPMLTQQSLQSFRADILTDFGANALEVEELLAYNQNVFERQTLNSAVEFPLTIETHVAVWEEYAAIAKRRRSLIAREIGVFETLKQRLVQLQFPIQQGISETEAYRAATRRGVSTNGMTEASGLVLQQSDRIELIIHQSLAGKIPVLLVENRKDFVALVQALCKRNEPIPIPASMGACLVSGLNNWDRIARYRQQWQGSRGQGAGEQKKRGSEIGWDKEFLRIIPQKHLYQDRLIILSSGFYSGVTAEDIGINESEWLNLSQKIRLEHECTHYLTLRLFGSMRNNMLDELIADYQGIVAANGYYRADWFLRFLGLESFPNYRQGGRLENYRGQPPLSDGALKILMALVKAAAENLERFDTEYADKLRDSKMQALMLRSLTNLTLEELASEEGKSRIQNFLESIVNLS